MLLDLETTVFSSPGEQINAFVEAFHKQWREEGRQKLELLLQSKINQIELELKGAKQKRCKQFQTPLGAINLTRRAYLLNGHYTCLADQYMGLPVKGWFVCFEKLACALGVSVDFAHASQLLHEFTGVELSDHGLANHVESCGESLLQQMALTPAKETYPMDSALSKTVQGKRSYSRVYMGADGILVPLNKGQGYKEAKVGVCFWDYQHVGKRRKEILKKNYVGTLDSRQSFSESLFKCYAETVNETPCEVVFLGDGAKWIWEMCSENYPEATQILDFFHVSEYVWDVARALFPKDSDAQKSWVTPQLQRLKESRWSEVIESLRFVKGKAAKESAKILKRYLENNSQRIDYKRYLELGLMIGSGVVESSNRRVVTQRLKQSGMHWSKYGANAVIALRACYLSDSDQWIQYWKQRTA